MLVICQNHHETVRFKNGLKGNNTFNFHFEQKFGVKNDNKHKRYQYFGENYKRFDKKLNKIKYNTWKNSYAKKEMN